MNRGAVLPAAVAVLAAAYWLFADTVRFWTGAGAEAAAIRFSFWGGFDDLRMWERIIAGFERGRAGPRVRPEFLPISGYATKMQQQLAAGGAPDVMLYQDEPFAVVASQAFVDLSPAERDPELAAALADCYDSAVTSFRAAGVLRGAPFSGGNLLVYCNRRAFERAGRFHGRPVTLPADDWTLDEFIARCRALTFDEDGDGEIDQFGFLQPSWVYYQPLLWAHGAELLDAGRSGWRFVGPAAEAALEFYQRLRIDWRVTPAPAEFAGQNADTAFLAGRVAMCLNGPWLLPFLRETRLRDGFFVAPIPRGPGGRDTRATWDGLCIARTCTGPRRDRALEFVKYCLTPDAQRVVAEHERAIPARRSVADVWAAAAPQPAVRRFCGAMQTARLQPITPCWSAMDRALKRTFADVIADVPPRPTAAQAARDLAASPEIAGCFVPGR